MQWEEIDAGDRGRLEGDEATLVMHTRITRPCQAMAERTLRTGLWSSFLGKPCALKGAADALNGATQRLYTFALLTLFTHDERQRSRV